MKKFVPDTVFTKLEGIDHEDMALFYPERMAQEPELPMPAFERLYRQMPSWEQIRNTYIIVLPSAMINHEC